MVIILITKLVIQCAKYYLNSAFMPNFSLKISILRVQNFNIKEPKVV